MIIAITIAEIISMLFLLTAEREPMLCSPALSISVIEVHFNLNIPSIGERERARERERERGRGRGGEREREIERERERDTHTHRHRLNQKHCSTCSHGEHIRNHHSHRCTPDACTLSVATKEEESRMICVMAVVILSPLSGHFLLIVQ